MSHPDQRYYTKLTRFVLFLMPRTRACRGTLHGRFRLMWYYITFFSKRYKDFEKSINANQSKPKGRPKVHPDSSLIIFFAIMLM